MKALLSLLKLWGMQLAVLLATVLLLGIAQQWDDHDSQRVRVSWSVRS